MKVIYVNKDTVINDSLVSAIGFFDGMHVGHIKLIDEVIHQSAIRGYKKAVITFDHYPLYVLGIVDKEYYISSINDRIKILEVKGIDYLIIIPFTKELANKSYQEFIEEYLIRLNIKHIVCGYDFHFGKDNLGDANILKKYNSKLSVSIVEEVTYDNVKISSSRIRKALSQGNIKLVNILLDRLYTIEGKVIEGRKIGNTIGYPTANIDYLSYYLPNRGVYGVKVNINNKIYLGMANIGYNPTVGKLDKISLEVNIFNFNENIYNQNISISFLDKVRDEVKFNNVIELKKQLTNDKKYIISKFNCILKNNY